MGSRNGSFYFLDVVTRPAALHPVPPAIGGEFVSRGDAHQSATLMPAEVADRRIKWDIRSSTRQAGSDAPGVPGGWWALRRR
jgi:hypothetical protein